MTRLDIFVPGVPIVQGSMVAVKSKTTGLVFLKHGSSKKEKALKKWRKLIAGHVLAKGAMRIEAGPVRLHLRFVLERPPSHLKKNGELRKNSPVEPWIQIGDLDKFARAAMDGLTETAYGDDSQVCELVATKEYGDPTGVRIVVEEL